VKLRYVSKVNRLFHQKVLGEIPQRLGALLGLPPSKVRVRQGQRTGSGKETVGLVAAAGSHRFVIAYKADGTAAPITAAARAVRASAQRLGKDAIPLVITPYMGEVGRRSCAELGICWMDLSGNACIEAPGLRIHFLGHPNLFKRRGRPGSLFAPKSARITHWLLANSDRSFTQRELGQCVGMGEGFVSRIVRGLEDQGMVVREPNGAVRVGDYDLLLDAWREAYDFSKHAIVRGHVAARSSDEILRQLAERFDGIHLQYAVTGLAGAWLWTHFAGFRLVVVYVAQNPGESLQHEVGFHEEQRGENVWLMMPNDEGVFLGASPRDGIMCVDPVQLYLDLKDHPERSAEAAARLREELLTRKTQA
jgi:DNA-binding MarR family transcriptional regulator